MSLPLIGGTLFLHNPERYDYCWRESLRSLLGVCDEVVVLDCYSDDGTWEELQDWEKQNVRLYADRASWNPSQHGKWLADLTNEARRRLDSEFHISLQADEVLHEDDYDLIRKCAAEGTHVLCPRLNFWHDTKHLIPPGKVCGDRVLRCAPTEVPSVGDAETLEHGYGGATVFSKPISIFHYGFIRRPEALVAKAIPMQEAFFGTHDPLLEDIRERGSIALLDTSKHRTAIALDECLPYEGTHPKVAHEWLRERGYEP